MKDLNQPQEKKTWFQKIAFTVTFYTGTLLPEILPSNKHWSHITDNLILGALPIATQILGQGNHRDKIMADCEAKGKPLGAVYSIVNPFEIKGENLGLKPVSPQDWKAKKVNHVLVPMDDFGGDIDVNLVKKHVDDMHKVIQSGKSVYVHCKAGKGRSFSFIVAYLLMHTDMDVTQIFAFIREKRPQVSPSAAQFKLIEKFRAEFCPNKAPLNKNSVHFQSYRKGLLKYKSNPVVQALTGGALALMTSTPVLQAGIAATTLLGVLGLRISNKFDQYAFNSAHEKNAISKLDLAQLEAVKCGMESATSWKSWGSHLLDLNAFRHYTSYRAGIRLKQELDPLCKHVDKKLTSKRRLK